MCVGWEKIQEPTAKRRNTRKTPRTIFLQPIQEGVSSLVWSARDCWMKPDEGLHDKTAVIPKLPKIVPNSQF